MTYFFSTHDKNFDSAFQEFLHIERGTNQNVVQSVTDIITQVKKDGDSALVSYTEKFDKFTPISLRLDKDTVQRAVQNISEELKQSLSYAAQRIKAYHNRQKPDDNFWTDDSGIELGWRWTPVDAAGLYVPGGTASYPSSVLMNAIPAQVAGVKRLVMCVPTPDNTLNPLVLYAAQLCNIDEIYCVGGAQAIAAMAYGTQSITKVNVITGPGNAYVAEAKRQVYGAVNIDMIAGPSEVLVISDKQSDPDHIAMDLLSQAEHDENAQSVLITDCAAFGQQVSDAVERALKKLPREKIARKSWEKFGAIITVENLDQAVHLSDMIAPEHLELCIDYPKDFAQKLRHAGSIFLGRHTPEAFGDYTAGPNHVLPTNGSAKFFSGLSVLNFMKRTSLLHVPHMATHILADNTVLLADAEGLDAHAMSARLRGTNKK